MNQDPYAVMGQEDTLARGPVSTRELSGSDLPSHDLSLPDGWRVIHQEIRQGRPAELFDHATLEVDALVRQFLANEAPRGIYRHQLHAIQLAVGGENVCLATGTASGKTLAFHASAVQQMAQSPNARVIAIYPQKSLANEQEERWRRALQASGISGGVSRIDGDVPVASRDGLIRNSRVVIVTPDIIHAWMLSNVGSASMKSLLKNLKLVIVDEVHTYSGVFGSNSALLFRRLRHACALLGSTPAFFCASATIQDPKRHLEDLCGVSFALVESDDDTSPQHDIHITLVEPPNETDFLRELTHFLSSMVTDARQRFIAFVDSRKQAESIATILNRTRAGKGASDEGLEGDAAELDSEIAGQDQELVMPYRAGYEESDRTRIQRRLTNGELRGVVSTSALELGIDIPHLDVAVLIGVPRSATSLTQRMGRVGRQRAGAVVIINSGDATDRALFRHPERVLKRPLARSTLYLENERIQYIHALCIAGSGGEHEAVGGPVDEPFRSEIVWPTGFVGLCTQEREGQIPARLQSMQSEGADDPHHTFPLRAVERQFSIELRRGPESQTLGSMSYGQVMREAFPGAVYLHMATPYRVTSISLQNRKVSVRREKFYHTKPTFLPAMVFPNLTHGNVHHAERRAELVVADCSLQVRESITGFKERRGNTEFANPYPLNPRLHASRVGWPSPRFSRTYHTSGVILSHAALSKADVKVDRLAALLLDAFLLVVPMDRQDIGSAADKLRADHRTLEKGRRFVAIFDQTYGSLRLSSRVLDAGVLLRTLERLVELVDADEELQESVETKVAAQALLDAAKEQPEAVTLSEGEAARGPQSLTRVILPESLGLNESASNAEYIIEAVLFSPRLGGIAYRARASGTVERSQTETWLISHFSGIPDVTRYGYFDPETGETQEDTATTGSANTVEESYG